MIYTRILNSIKAKNWPQFRSTLVNGIREHKIQKLSLSNIYKSLRSTEEGKQIADAEVTFVANNNETEWNEDYMEEIASAIICGDTNEKVAEHMVEVSNKLKWKDNAYRLKVIVFSACATIAVIVTVICLIKRN